MKTASNSDTPPLRVTAIQLKRGARYGFIIGSGFSAAVVVLYAIRGPILAKRLGLSLPELIACYIVGGIVGGIVAGGLGQFQHRRWGPSLIGFCAVLPLSLGATALVVPRDDWVPAGVVIAVIVALLFGAGLGPIVKNDLS